MRHVDFELRSPDGLRFYGQCWTPEAEPRAAVCLVHGFGEHSGRHGHLAEYLTARSYALLGVDLRGHGRSEGRRGHTPSWDTLLDDVARSLDDTRQRFPGLPVFLYGHSMGGLIVLSFALRRRPSLAGVVATGPLLRLKVEPPAWERTFVGLAVGVLPTLSIPSGIDPMTLAHDPQVARAYVDDPLVFGRISLRLAQDLMTEGPWVLAHAAEFPLPLLLMHGDADKINSFAASKEFAERVPVDCTFRAWPGLYHEIHNEPEQGEVFAEVVAWLAAHERTETGAR